MGRAYLDARFAQGALRILSLGLELLFVVDYEVTVLIVDAPTSFVVVDRLEGIFIVEHRLDSCVGADVDAEVLFDEDHVGYQEECRAYPKAHEDRVVGRILDVAEEVLRGHEIPDEVRCCDECEHRPEQNRHELFDLVLRFTHIGLDLFVADSLSKMQQLRLD